MVVGKAETLQRMIFAASMSRQTSPATAVPGAITADWLDWVVLVPATVAQARGQRERCEIPRGVAGLRHDNMAIAEVVSALLAVPARHRFSIARTVGFFSRRGAARLANLAGLPSELLPSVAVGRRVECRRRLSQLI